MKLTKARLQQIIREEMEKIAQPRVKESNISDYPMAENPFGFVEDFIDFWEEERAYSQYIEADEQPDYEDVELWAFDNFSANEAKYIASYVFDQLKNMRRI
jgi:hypothetical protein